MSHSPWVLGSLCPYEPESQEFLKKEMNKRFWITEKPTIICDSGLPKNAKSLPFTFLADPLTRKYVLKKTQLWKTALDDVTKGQ